VQAKKDPLEECCHESIAAMSKHRCGEGRHRNLFQADSLRLSALDSGLTFAPVGVAFATASLLMRPLIAKHGLRVMSWGLVLTTTGLLGTLITVHLSGDGTSGFRLAPWLFVTGIGNGCVMPSLIGVVLTGVPAQKAGGAAGTLTTGQQFSLALGVAGLGEVFFGVLGHQPTLQRYISAIQDVLLLDCGLLVISLALLGLLPRATRAASQVTTAVPVDQNALAIQERGVA